MNVLSDRRTPCKSGTNASSHKTEKLCSKLACVQGQWSREGYLIARLFFTLTSSKIGDDKGHVAFNLESDNAVRTAAAEGQLVTDRPTDRVDL